MTKINYQRKKPSDQAPNQTPGGTSEPPSKQRPHTGVAFVTTAVGSLGLKAAAASMGLIDAAADWREQLAFLGVAFLVSCITALITHLGFGLSGALGLSAIGAASALFLRDSIPTAALGLTIGTVVAVYYSGRLVRWLLTFVVAAGYGAAVGGLVHYLLEYHHGWLRFVEAGGVTLVGLAMAVFVVGWLREPHPDERFASMKKGWRLANQGVLLLLVFAGSALSLVTAGTVDWAELSRQWREPVERQARKVENAAETVQEARRWEVEIERLLGSDKE